MENAKITEYKKVCPVCGKEFTTTNKRKIHCCANCKAALYRDKHRNVYKKVCPICGKEFTVNRRLNVYCSRECYEKSKVIYRKEHRVLKEQPEKVCPVCGKKFVGKNSRRTYCSRKCKEIAYKQTHSEEILEKSRIRYQNNKERYKKWEEANREKRLRQKHEYYINHKEEIKERAEQNKERIRVNNRNRYHKNKKNPIYRLIRKCRDFVHRCLKSTKLYRTNAVLGYTPEELRNHLEANFYGNMSWDVQDWEIHHIKPVDTFNFLNEDGTDNYETIREANSLSNLMPLFKKDHKKVTALYLSENKCLNKEEIKQMFVGDK